MTFLDWRKEMTDPNTIDYYGIFLQFSGLPWYMYKKESVILINVTDLSDELRAVIQSHIIVSCRNLVVCEYFPTLLAINNLDHKKRYKLLRRISSADDCRKKITYSSDDDDELHYSDLHYVLGDDFSLAFTIPAPKDLAYGSEIYIYNDRIVTDRNAVIRDWIGRTYDNIQKQFLQRKPVVWARYFDNFDDLFEDFRMEYDIKAKLAPCKVPDATFFREHLKSWLKEVREKEACKLAEIKMELAKHAIDGKELRKLLDDELKKR